MASELQYYGNTLTESGLTVVARLYDDNGVQISGDIATSEAGNLAIYTGDMPIAPAGTYAVRFFWQTQMLGQGCMFWDGAKEVTVLDGAGAASEIFALL